jgi:hypothetical protein
MSSVAEDAEWAVERWREALRGDADRVGVIRKTLEEATADPSSASRREWFTERVPRALVSGARTKKNEATKAALDAAFGVGERRADIRREFWYVLDERDRAEQEKEVDLALRKLPKDEQERIDALEKLERKYLRENKTYAYRSVSLMLLKI